MARSHILAALGAAIVASLIISQLVIHLGFPSVDFWHDRLDQSNHAQHPFYYGSKKQSGELVDDPASYLLGVGKADITGYFWYSLGGMHD